tara:strand:- start:23 stop:361 length:339 start_codon:yes stop_codon:yes gene_type:complete
MKAHMMREVEADGTEGKPGTFTGEGWLRVSRPDIEEWNITLTADSRLDDEYVYLGEDDAQLLFTALLQGGAYYQDLTQRGSTRLGYGSSSEAMTFEWTDRPSPIRDLPLATS